VIANQSQRSDEVKYGRQTWRGMQRGAHVCQRSDTKWDWQTDLTGHADGHVCLSEKRRSEKRQTDWMGHAEERACLSAEWRSEIRQTNWTGHAVGHACLSEEQHAENGAHHHNLLLLNHFSSNFVFKTDKSKTLCFTFGGSKKRTKNNFGWLMFSNWIYNHNSIGALSVVSIWH
jgi:hypothetical protein